MSTTALGLRRPTAGRRLHRKALRMPPPVTAIFCVTLPVSGAPVFQKYLFEEFEKLYGGMWGLELDPIKHAHKMIAHIDKKRQGLGIDRRRARILVDMADRRALETA